MSDRQHMDTAYLRPGKRSFTKRSRWFLTMLGVSLVVIVTLSLVADQWLRSSRGVHVNVIGTMFSTVSDIEKLAAIPDSANLADLDLMEIQRRVEKHPYVKRAMIRRDPPATLIVEVVERSPIALLLNPDGSEWMIDDEGFIFPVTNYPGAQDLPVLTHMQNITGARAGERLSDPKILSAARVLRTARTLDSSIYDLISEINLDHRQDLLMYTTDCGIPVVFGPEEDVEVKLWSLKAFWETVAVKEDPAMLEYLDLRFKNQVVAKWAHGTVSSQNEVRSDSTDIIKD